MPPRNKFTREEIADAALELTAEKGIDALTARGLAQRLGASPKVIFGLFRDMEEVRQEVMAGANRRYRDYLEKGMAEGKYPPYKASGMAYIRFAGEQRELFRLLFMRDRTGEKIGEDLESIAPILDILQKNLGLSREDAYRFHLESWIVVHGFATMIATSYLEWEDGYISSVLTDVYQGLKYRFTQKTKGIDENGRD